MDKKETNPGVRYERKDIRPSRLLAAMVLAACVMITLSYGMWQFFWWQADAEQQAKRRPYPPAATPSPRLPPEPRLEQLDRLAGVEMTDVNHRLAVQEKSLNSYGPTEEKGFVHIPIHEAIKATAGKLPVRKSLPGPAANDNGLINSGESNSGRMFRGDSP